MGTSSSKSSEYIKLSADQRTLLKQIWIGIENNPQFHGIVFFTGFCEMYPQYTKYFTTASRLPLNFDALTHAKFTVIMETMGYLLLDFHNRTKQLDKIIGYIAMVHKDMNLTRSDMFNFGASLLEYLSVTFPMAMSPECLEVTSKYMNNLLDVLSQKIEEFNRDDILGNYHTLNDNKITCGQWLFCRDNLIYGQTPHYWRERKSIWDDRLNEWKLNNSSIANAVRTLSTDDEETSYIKSRTEDETSEFAESTARLLESHGIPRKTKIDISSQTAAPQLDPTRAASLSHKFGNLRDSERSQYHTKKSKDSERIENFRATSSNVSSFKTPREKRRMNLEQESKIVESGTARLPIIPDEETRSIRRSTASTEHRESASSQVPVKPQKIDSIARQRRRQTRDRAPQGRSPSVYF